MSETLARVSMIMMIKNIAIHNVSVKMETKSSIECAAQNKIVVVSGYGTVTFLEW